MHNTCTQCSAVFEVTDGDITFYDKISPVLNGKKYSIPSPTLCPNCREQQRAAFRNERSLYKRKCDLTGESIIAVLSSDCPYTVYSQKAWWSDEWNPLEYGREFDFNRPFFEQFAELMKEVPQIALLNLQTENSEYCHRIYDGRNNYLSCVALYEPENLYYTYYTMNSKDCTDISVAQYSELCYEVTDAEHCYNCSFSNRIRNCSDSYFLQDCIGCSHCFGCKNLHQQKYCIFNEQYTKEEYRRFLSEYDFSSHSFTTEQIQKVQQFFLKFPNKPTILIHSENVSGDNIYNCKDSVELYDFYESERMRYCSMGEKSHDCLGCYGLGCAEHSLESITLQYANNICFSATAINSSNLWYCYECYADTHHCFGCVSMKKGKYCIFNKQYSKQEYETLVAKIIEHMRKTSEWGQFFPSEISPYSYNETVAQDYYPLAKEEILAKGWKWKEEEKFDSTGITKKIPAVQLPDSTADIPDDILNWAIQCKESGRLFKIQKAELEFYRKMNLPIPHFHPDVRHQKRMQLRNPRKLWTRNCAKCKKEIQTTYSPERPEMIYCEGCYLEEVY